MAVPYKFAVFLALLLSVTVSISTSSRIVQKKPLISLWVYPQTNSGAEPAYGNDVTLGNYLFDAITGELQLPEPGVLGILNECAAIYTVRNVEILIIAGIKIRQCNNVDEGLLQNYLQGSRSAHLKIAFQEQVIACSTRKCYADQVGSN